MPLYWNRHSPRPLVSGHPQQRHVFQHAKSHTRELTCHHHASRSKRLGIARNLRYRSVAISGTLCQLASLFYTRFSKAIGALPQRNSFQISTKGRTPRNSPTIIFQSVERTNPRLSRPESPKEASRLEGLLLTKYHTRCNKSSCRFRDGVSSAETRNHQFHQRS